MIHVVPEWKVILESVVVRLVGLGAWTIGASWGSVELSWCMDFGEPRVDHGCL